MINLKLTIIHEVTLNFIHVRNMYSLLPLRLLSQARLHRQLAVCSELDPISFCDRFLGMVVSMFNAQSVVFESAVIRNFA